MLRTKRRGEQMRKGNAKLRKDGVKQWFHIKTKQQSQLLVSVHCKLVNGK